MKRILAAIIILAASVAPAWASTWYISTTGSDTNPGTSSAFGVKFGAGKFQ
jgi:hypothetical protein